MLWAQSTTKDYIRIENNFNLSPRYSFHKSLHQKSLFLKPQLKFYPQFRTQSQKNNNTRIGAYLYFAGTQHGNLHPARWPILFCGSTQEPVLATANTRKIRERLRENAGEWTGRAEIRKKSLAVGIACMAIYWPTPGFKGRTFKLCVLIRWDFNFCNQQRQNTIIWRLDSTSDNRAFHRSRLVPHSLTHCGLILA